MIILNSVSQVKNYLSQFRDQNKIIGFVPTMGALHKGHISLVDVAKSQCDIIVCSIFVNPTQFNDLTDLEKYPRTIKTDCQLLEKSGCSMVFIPEVSEIYSQEELELKKRKIEDKSWAEGKNIDFGLLGMVMEGKQRPGHFNGVAQVVSKLFKIINPHKAYFGQKDFQQLAIIRSKVLQMALPVEIIACPIIREENGLAMSSRNERLSEEERSKASLISKTLFKVKELKNSKTIAELKTFAESQIGTEPLMQLEYFEISDSQTLQPITNFDNVASAVACIALKVGEVRLIDNVVLY